MMAFTKKPLEWNAVGVEPNQEKKDQGFGNGEYPAAGHFDFKFNSDYEVLKELQEKAGEVKTVNGQLPDTNGNVNVNVDTSGFVTTQTFDEHKTEDATNAKKGHVQLVDDVIGNSDSLVPTQNAVRKKVEQTGYKKIKSGKDSNGIFTIIEERRKSDNTLSERSVLSGGTSPRYTTRTTTYYGIDGTTVEKTETFTLSYDSDGDCTSEV